MLPMPAKSERATRRLFPKSASPLSAACRVAWSKMCASRWGVLRRFRFACGKPNECCGDGRSIPICCSWQERLRSSEIHPIDDIRSTARYRAAVAGNLVVEFLNRLGSEQAAADGKEVSDILARWNLLSTDDAISAILPCCGSRAWAQGVVARRPLRGRRWRCWQRRTKRGAASQPSDWMEAFQSHPRIGESRAPQSPPAQSVAWSTQEQQQVADADAAAEGCSGGCQSRIRAAFQSHLYCLCHRQVGP